MGGKLSWWRYETCAQAYEGAKSELARDMALAASGDDNAKFRALHVIQDSYSMAHRYQPWIPLNYGLGHIAADEIWSNAPVKASTAFLKALEGKTPMGAPEDYLFHPSGCH